MQPSTAATPDTLKTARWRPASPAAAPHPSPSAPSHGSFAAPGSGCRDPGREGVVGRDGGRRKWSPSAIVSKIYVYRMSKKT